MAFAFVFYLIQNKKLRQIIIVVLKLLFYNQQLPVGEESDNHYRRARQFEFHERPNARTPDYPAEITPKSMNQNYPSNNPRQVGEPIAMTVSSQFEAVNLEVMRQLEVIFGPDDPNLLAEWRDRLWELAITNPGGQPEVVVERGTAEMGGVEVEMEESCTFSFNVRTKRVRFEI